MVVVLVSWLPGKLEAEGPVSKTALKEAVSRGSKLIVGMQENLGAKGSPSSEWPYEGVYRVRSPGKRRGMIPIGYRVGGTAICSWALLKTPGYRSSKSAQAAVKRGRDFIVAALKEYKSGDRAHPTMHAQAASMSDQDMEDIAAFLTQAPRNKIDK